MQAVISLIPEPYTTRIKQIWDTLQAHFGLEYFRIAPVPHFTWQLGEGYQEEEVLPLLHELTLKQEPFEVRTNGLNYFPGESPVLFIEVRKSLKLTKLHALIWKQLFPFTCEPSPLYSVENWQPHITLPTEDLGWQILDEVTENLNHTNMKWRFKLDNLAIGCQHADDKAQVEHIFRFGKGLTVSFDCGLPAENF